VARKESRGKGGAPFLGGAVPENPREIRIRKSTLSFSHLLEGDLAVQGSEKEGKRYGLPANEKGEEVLSRN